MSKRAWYEILKQDPCAYCGGKNETVDHITPRSKGGRNTWDNVAPACYRCNQRKADRSLLVFLITEHHSELQPPHLSVGGYRSGRRQILRYFRRHHLSGTPPTVEQLSRRLTNIYGKRARHRPQKLKSILEAMAECEVIEGKVYFIESNSIC